MHTVACDGWLWMAGHGDQGAKHTFNYLVTTLRRDMQNHMGPASCLPNPTCQPAIELCPIRPYASPAARRRYRVDYVARALTGADVDLQ